MPINLHTGEHIFPPVYLHTEHHTLVPAIYGDFLFRHFLGSPFGGVVYFIEKPPFLLCPYYKGVMWSPYVQLNYNGSLTSIVVPFPFLLIQVIEPPSKSTILFTIERPRPLPFFYEIHHTDRISQKFYLDFLRLFHSLHLELLQSCCHSRFFHKYESCCFQANI